MGWGGGGGGGGTNETCHTKYKYNIRSVAQGSVRKPARPSCSALCFPLSIVQSRPFDMLDFPSGSMFLAPKCDHPLCSRSLWAQQKDQPKKEFVFCCCFSFSTSITGSKLIAHSFVPGNPGARSRDLPGSRWARDTDLLRIRAMFVAGAAGLFVRIFTPLLVLKGIEISLEDFGALS